MSTGRERETTYDVRVWKIERVKGKKATSYKVVWIVAGKRRKEPFGTDALAESFRAELLTAMRRGEAFDVATGHPVSKVRTELPTVSWYDFACQYVDMKWPGASPKHRQGIAEALITVTPVMLDTDMDAPTAKAIRSALLNWGFTSRRGSSEQPHSITDRLEWVAKHSRPLADISEPTTTRQVLDAVATRLDGTRAAGRTAHRKRAVLTNAVNYALELGLLLANPIKAVRWQAPRSAQVVDRRSVANPSQARTLLNSVRATPRSGPHLVAFFGCLYYSALRPEEAVDVREPWLDLPEDGGWGWMTLETAAPEAGRQWSDTGERREQRQLKHRAVDDTRRVPVPPALVALLREHLDEYGVDAQGRLFRGERGDALASVTYLRLWDRARRSALTPAQYASPLARRPYDLRHACVSTWLNGGVAPTQVAEWAGHSVDVLLKIYAKCIDGQEHIALRRIDQALADRTEPPTEGERSSDLEDPPPERGGE